MRKTLLFLALASAAMPAIAAPQDGDERVSRWEAARAARAEARAERQAEQAPRAERAAPAERAEPRAQSPMFQRGGGDAPIVRAQPVDPFARHRAIERRALPDSDARPAGRQPQLEEAARQRAVERWVARSGNGDAARPTLEQPRKGVDTVREWRSRERQAGTAPATIEERSGTFRQVFAPRREPEGRTRDSIGGRRSPLIRTVPLEGSQPPEPVAERFARVISQHWRGDWRSDRRYDWRDHRRRHRSLFHFGIYHDPFGWRYRPYSIGWRLWPSYYRSSYWLNDPWLYRLPYAPPGYRWIRYYDDALLVDTWDGQVVDVIRNFFW